MQKRIIRGNLKEIFATFQQEYPEIKKNFTKFAKLRPKFCVLANSGGTHRVCVCPIHQNMKLMDDGSHVVNMMKSLEYPVIHVKDVLLQLMCDNPSDKCYLGQCKSCPGDAILNTNMLDIFEKKNVKQVVYKQWVSKPRANLETVTESVEKFINNFCSYGKTFLNHYFIANEQASVYKNIRENLKFDECLITCDFAENYAFVVQDAIPGYHWNNSQATLFTVVLYYNDNGTIKHKTLIIISDCMKHDSVAVYVFIKALHEFISTFNPNLRKCIYFSDGAPQQFKNVKHFANIFYHEQDFGRSAEWHFHATAHGKGPCDGAGGTLKRLARKASLQMTYHISNSTQLFQWADQESTLPRIKVMHRNTNDYNLAQNFLKSRFEDCKTITGTQKLHYIRPLQSSLLETKIYSSSTESNYVCFSKKQNRKKFKVE